MNNKKGLDERQREQRNAIGNQMFILAFYLLMLDAGLYGFSIKWLPYPANVIVIITVCMAIYVVRLIARGSYIPPETQRTKPLLHTVIIVVASIVLAGILAFAVMKMQVSPPDGQNDNSAMVMMIVSGVGLLVAAAVAVIKRIRDSKDE
jgi:O-antigen/teichoic acid export membrane protein